MNLNTFVKSFISDCAKPTIDHATISPADATINSGAKYSVTCGSGYTISGNAEITCTDGTLSASPTCLQQCTKPTIDHATISPADATINSGSKYSVTCGSGYTISGNAEITCTDGTLSTNPTCLQQCIKPTIDHATISPADATINSGAKYSVTCGSGYTISGNAEITCTDGTLSASPTCLQQCTKPTIDHATISPADATINSGSKYLVTCGSGYTISGNAEITCTDGTLSASPTCLQQCTKPTIDHATISPADATINSGSKYLVTCGSGFTISGNAEITCTDGALSASPTCLQQCAKPIIDHATISPADATINSGSKYSVTCGSGYTISGNAEITCTDGTLSASPTCLQQCTKPTIDHATISPADATINSGSKYSVTCGSGYTISGNAEITCTDGALSASPTCLQQCAKPTIDHATISPADATINSGAKYSVTCGSGYTISGNAEITCTDGTLSASPTCLQQCTKPTIEFASISPADSSIIHGAVYTVNCQSGYTILGHDKLTCNDGSLSDTPTCVKNSQNCVKPTIDHAVLDPNTNSIESGQSYSVTCNTGYTISGSSTVSCTDGTLSASPTCLQQCTKPTIDHATISPADATINSGAKYSVTCGSGYTISGNAEITCTDGTLSTSPTCLQQCTKPTIDHATISPADATINSGAKYSVTCGSGYTISGNAEITCTDGTLSTSPTCLQQCTKPTIDHATISPADATINSGSKYSVTCGSGYTISGNAEITCTDGTLSASPTCLQQCAKPTIDHATISPADATINSGAKYSVTCGSGYTISGNAEITCTDGTLSASPTCLQQCAKPTIDHATISPADATINSGAKYSVTCGSGYTISGNAEITCTEGTLSTSPTCLQQCTKPTIDHATISPADATINSGAKYSVTCGSGYTISGDAEITCTDGTLSASPTCLQQCTKPTIEFASISPADSSIIHGAVYTVNCQSGYTILGHDKLTCNDGSLSDTPTCVKNSQNCVKPTIDHAVLDPNTNSIESGQSYSVTCNTGYTISGSSTVSCTDGTLSASPTCLQQCTKPTIDHATISPADATINSGAKYSVTCGSGYTISGDAEITCTDGTLSASPTCLQQCTKPTIDHATISPADATINSGAKYSVTCGSGYTISGDAEITCTDGTLSASPTCLQQCTKPTIDHATISPADATINSGSKYSVTCGSGYTISGDAEITCTDGTLSASPTCLQQCTKPTIDHATISPADATINSGSKYSVTCGSVYTISGNAEITCTDGTLSASPTCLQQCTKPTIDHATISPADATINSGSKYSVTCGSGYTISGDAEITCTDGKLSASPTCLQQCTKPTIDHATISPADATINSGSKYSVTCGSGYTISGNAEITCTDGTLSASPTCLQQCTKPTIDHATISPADATINSGAKYSVTCGSGYTISGNAEITCTDGTLSTIPSCSKDAESILIVSVSLLLCQFSSSFGFPPRSF